MKKIFITLSVLLAGLAAASRADAHPENDSAPGREERRQARKERREERMKQWKQDMADFRQGRDEDNGLTALIDSISWLQAESAVKNLSFVVEADYLTFRRGNRISVNSGTNFISLDGDRAVVQISPSYSHAGPNGVGGVTVTGRASDIKTSIDKKGRVTWSMSIIGVGISAQVNISAVPGTNKVMASVYPNFNSNIITLEGTLVPYENSRIFEGRSLF